MTNPAPSEPDYIQRAVDDLLAPINPETTSPEQMDMARTGFRLIVERVWRDAQAVHAQETERLQGDLVVALEVARERQQEIEQLQATNKAHIKETETLRAALRDLLEAVLAYAADSTGHCPAPTDQPGIIDRAVKALSPTEPSPTGAEKA